MSEFQGERNVAATFAKRLRSFSGGELSNMLEQMKIAFGDKKEKGESRGLALWLSESRGGTTTIFGAPASSRRSRYNRDIQIKATMAESAVAGP